MAYKTFTSRFPVRKLHKKKHFEKMRGTGQAPRRAGRKERGISRRGK